MTTARQNADTAITRLTTYVRRHGPIAAVRVSSAKARGAAKAYSYWGAARYEIRISTRGVLISVATERATSDRRSFAGAERDAELIAIAEHRVEVQAIGEIRESEAHVIMRQLGQTESAILNAMSDPQATMVVYKSVALPHDTPRSIYDGTKWQLGVRRVASTMRHAPGALYAAATIADAMRAPMPDEALLARHRRAVIRCEATAVRTVGKKLICGTITPLAIVAVQGESHEWSD